MTLNATTLKSEIFAITGNPANYPGDPVEAAQKLADAYDTYAQDATDLTGDGPITVNKSGFQSSLNFTVGNTAAQAALAFELAVIAYWTSAKFDTSTPPPGSVTKISSTIIIPPISNGLLLTVFSDISGADADTKAQQIADALHSMTITGAGIIQHTIPSPSGPIPGPPLPFTII